jgi:transposase
MARPLSMDLRERVVEAIEEGSSRRAAAQRFGVSESCAIKLMQRWQETGVLAPGQMGGHKNYALAAHADRVQALVKAQPDITIDELHAHLTGDGIAVGRSAVGRFLQSLGLTRKKRRSMRPSRSARTSRQRAPPGTSTSRR